jgi:putative transposase
MVDGFYHVYNRGTDHRIIFQDEQDYKRFIIMLYLCNSTSSINLRDYFDEGKTLVDMFEVQQGERIVDIGGYCLMPNHFHLILHERMERGISLFMQKISTGYTMYFNKINKRTGGLFQGKFQAKHADTDEYLKYLFAYVHLNPVKLIDLKWKDKGISDLQKAKEYLETYRYSSYHDFLGKKRTERKILNTNVFPKYFTTERDFEEYIHDWLHYDEKEMEEKLKKESHKIVEGSVQE